MCVCCLTRHFSSPNEVLWQRNRLTHFAAQIRYLRYFVIIQQLLSLFYFAFFGFDGLFPKYKQKISRVGFCLHHKIISQLLIHQSPCLFAVVKFYFHPLLCVLIYLFLLNSFIHARLQDALRFYCAIISFDDCKLHMMKPQ